MSSPRSPARTETLSKSAVVIVEAQIAELPQRIATIASQGFVLFDLVEPCYYDNALWQCDAILLREDVHQAALRRPVGSIRQRQIHNVHGLGFRAPQVAPKDASPR